MTERLLEEDAAVVNDLERRLLIRDIQHEMLGFGPLELLMTDPAISDILVNRHDQIYVERLGRLELTPVVFTDDKHLLRINTLDQLDEAHDEQKLFSQEISNQIEALDYSDAATQLSNVLLSLQVTQQAYGKVNNLSLFNYL